MKNLWDTIVEAATWVLQATLLCSLVYFGVWLMAAVARALGMH